MHRNRWITVFFVLLFSACAAQEQKTPAAPDAPPSAIPAEEAHFSPEQLKEYYLVYTNPDVRYLRELFNAYLHGEAGKEAEYELLKPWSSDYYKSKFMVCSRNESAFGGAFITLMFQDRPDKVFVAWVYPEGEARTLTLRSWELAKFSDEDIKRIRVRYKELLNDHDHAM
jgi:hypothetical protein